jgi:ABC-type sugar transport system substrate-binding protein
VTSQPDSRPKRGRQRYVLLGVVVAIFALVLSACSSSKSSTTASSPAAGASSSSAPAASGAPASGSGGATTGLAAAQAMVAKYSVRPTTIPVPTPVGATVPKGKTVYFISCGTPECTQEAAIIKQGTDALGWKLDTVNTDGTPETEKAAFDQAARAKPAGVLYTAIDQSVFQSDIAAIHAGGGILSACCITDPISSTGIDYGVEIPTQTGFVGQLQAAFVASDSNGSDGDSVFVNIPSIPILTFAETNYKQTMPTFCSTCTVDTLDVPITALGKDVPARIVSYLRAHSSVKYVAMSTDSLAIGVPAALKAAGLTGIKIVGQGATSTNLQYLHSGQQAVSVAFPYYESMMMMLDAVVRHAAGVPILASVTPPQWLLTASNAPTTDNIFPIVTDVVAQFEKLWGVGS